jgi:hypothetical protein
LLAVDSRDQAVEPVNEQLSLRWGKSLGGFGKKRAQGHGMCGDPLSHGMCTGRLG